MIKEHWQVDGMTCGACERRIEKKLQGINGVHEVHASASKNLVTLSYDPVLVSDAALKEALLKEDFRVIGTRAPVSIKKWGLILAAYLGLGLLAFLTLRYGGGLLNYDFLPNIRQSMGYGTLFVVGIMTSVHCVAMCGAINMSQCKRTGYDHAWQPSLLYNLGRVVSYTLIGGIIGGIGSVLSFSGKARGYVTLFVAAIMILMALKMLKLFHGKTWRLPIPKLIKQPLYGLYKKGPFFVGLANGFMPCGPLQSMQLYALGTGSVLIGALSMLYFSLGTVPLMFSLGFLTSFLNKSKAQVLLRISGILIFILALTMFSRGAALAGIYIPFQYSGQVERALPAGQNLQKVSIDLASNAYTPIEVKVNIPVELTIYAGPGTLNGCNNPITIPAYDLEQTLVPGQNILTFTPTEVGRESLSCWMGMISSYIEVVE